MSRPLVTELRDVVNSWDVVNSCRAKKKRRVRRVIPRALVKAESCLNLTSDSTGGIAGARLLFTSPEVHYVRNEVRRYIGARAGRVSRARAARSGRLLAHLIASFRRRFFSTKVSRRRAAYCGSSCRSRIDIREVVPVEYSPRKWGCRRAREEREEVTHRSFLGVSSRSSLAFPRSRVLALSVSFRSALRGESLVSDRSRLFRDTRATSRDIEIFESSVVGVPG